MKRNLMRDLLCLNFITGQALYSDYVGVIIYISRNQYIDCANMTTRIITVSSAKGGVGKTTFVANIASALARRGKSVIAVDANLTTSNLGIHLGIPLYPTTLQDVLKGRSRLKDALYYHPAGFRVLPADISLKKIMLPKSSELMDIFYKLSGSADFIIIDSAAGLGKEAQSAIEAADEVITITNPEMPAMTDAIKAIKIAEKYETKHLGVVVNRVRHEKGEPGRDEIEEFLDAPILGHIHEDDKIRASIRHKQPIVLHSPNAKSSAQFREIASKILGEDVKTTDESAFIQRIFGWLR
jgi:cell division ATPase MinD